MYQGVVLANGLVASFWGPWPGSGNDREMVRESGFLQTWAQCTPFRVGGDCGYALSTGLMVPYPESPQMSQVQRVSAMYQLYDTNNVQFGDRTSMPGLNHVVRQLNGRLEPKEPVSKACLALCVPSYSKGASSERLPTI